MVDLVPLSYYLWVFKHTRWSRMLSMNGLAAKQARSQEHALQGKKQHRAKSRKKLLQKRSEESGPLFGPSVVHSNRRSLSQYRNCSHIFLLPWMTHPECLRRLEREKIRINHFLVRISFVQIFCAENAGLYLSYCR